MPHPVSAMTICTSGPDASMLTLARPAGPSDWAALSSRLRKSCSSAIASPSTHAGDPLPATWSIVPPCAANVASALCAAARSTGSISTRRRGVWPLRAVRNDPLIVASSRFTFSRARPISGRTGASAGRLFFGPLQVNANGRQSVANLVRQRRGILAHGRECLPLRQLAESAAKVLGHAVECGGDAAHFVGPAAIHLMFEVAAGHGVGGHGEPCQRAG